jgi:hypothetical protein
MLDILVCMFSSYFRADRELERSTKVVVLAYMQSWFLFDLLACIPFDQVLTFVTDGQQADCKIIMEIYYTEFFKVIYGIFWGFYERFWGLYIF